MSQRFSDHFSAVSTDYATFRPTYPAALFAWLAELCDARETAWDCGTGSGQAARMLATHFERVIATDASAAQIESATPAPRVAFRVRPAEDPGLADASVDLVTVAQALHWFDRERFFAEVARVLRPGGVLAVWTYGPLTVEGEAVDALVQHYYNDIIGPYWPPERALVDAGYADIALPFAELEAPPFAMEADWDLEGLLGYVSTWSATSRYREEHDDDPVAALRERLAPAWGAPDTRRRVTWPLTVRVARKDRERG